MAFKNVKMQPNTAASAKACSKTAGPDGRFPVGDKKHARLAISGATRSEHAGHISPATEQHIKQRAEEMLIEGTPADNAADKRNHTREGSAADKRQDAKLAEKKLHAWGNDNKPLKYK